MNKLKSFLNCALFLAAISHGWAAAPPDGISPDKVRRYELRVHNTVKNVTGVEVEHALAINGSIPAPTLHFRLGDWAIIQVTNETDEPTTLHWHGVLLPWRQDGPQFTNTKIIEPHSQHTFEFPIVHTGTYWYHSHTELQEQRGLYGAIVIEDDLTPEIDHDVVVVMSDWTNEHPAQVLANLKRDGHYYEQKQEAVRSLLDAARRGTKALGDYFKSQWQRMNPMDFGDVGYDAFLINGEQTSVLKNARHGEKIRFRLINAAASTYFYFNIGRLRNFTVISKDGMPVTPVTVNELLIGMGETYDIVFHIPHQSKTFEAKATAQDTSGSASLLFGSGDIEEVPEELRPSLYTMKEMDHGDHQQSKPSEELEEHQHPQQWPPQVEGSFAVNRLTYPMLQAATPTAYDQNLIRAKVIDLELSGDMERYTWYINGKPFSEDKYIEIRENEVITFRMINTTMMHHPMHLHGHFFRLLAGQGKSAPLFHTVDVAPMSTVTIEFHADRPGIWFLHCHNLYHMKMGMARLVKYENIERPPELIEDEKKWSSKMTHDNTAFWSREIELSSNAAEMEIERSAGRYQAIIEIELKEPDLDHIEVETFFRKYVDRFLSLGAGSVYDDQKLYAVLTALYNLPGDIELEGYMRHDGVAKIKLTKSIPISENLEFEVEPKLQTLSKDDPHRHHSFLDWSLKLELYYNHNEKFSFGANYRYSGHHHNHRSKSSTGIGVKISF